MFYRQLEIDQYKHVMVPKITICPLFNRKVCLMNLTRFMAKQQGCLTAELGPFGADSCSARLKKRSLPWSRIHNHALKVVFSVGKNRKIRKHGSMVVYIND